MLKYFLHHIPLMIKYLVTIAKCKKKKSKQNQKQEETEEKLVLELMNCI